MNKYIKWISRYIFTFVINLGLFYLANRWSNLFEINPNLKILQTAFILTIGSIFYDLCQWLLKAFKQKRTTKK